MINFKDIPKDIIQQLDKSLQTIINQDKEIAELKAELDSITHDEMFCECIYCSTNREDIDYTSDYNEWWGIPDKD